MNRAIDIDLPVRLLAQRRPFEEVMAALEDLLQRAHAARNYGAIVALEGARVTVLSVYRRPAEDLVQALDNYISMQPDPIECSSKALVACVDQPELVPRYIPAAIAAISELPQEDHIAALLARLREVHASSSTAS